MGHRIAPALVIASFALACGCALVSGASELEVVDDDTSVPPRTSDGAAPDGSMPLRDGAAAEADAADASITKDATSSLPASRLRAVTFEAGQTTGPQGVDQLTGAGVLVVGADALAGAYALRLDTGSARVGFAARPEIWLSALVKPKAGVVILSLPLGGSQTLFVDIVSVGGNGKLAVRARFNGSVVGTSAGLDVDKVARIGLHLRQGVGDGLVEAWAASGNVTFGASFASFGSAPFLEAFQALDFGETSAQASSGLVVDEIQIDDAAMPAP